MYFGVSEPIWAKNYTPLVDTHVPLRVLSKTTDEKVNWPPILSIAANNRPLKRNEKKDQPPTQTRYKIITDHWLCAPDAYLHNEKILFVHDNGDIIQPYGDGSNYVKKGDNKPELPDICQYFNTYHKPDEDEDIPWDYIEFVPHGSKTLFHTYPYNSDKPLYPFPSYCEFSIKQPSYAWLKRNDIPEEYKKDINAFAIAGYVRRGWWNTSWEDLRHEHTYKGEYITIFWKSPIYIPETMEYREVILSRPIRIRTRGVSIYAEPQNSSPNTNLTIAGGGKLTNYTSPNQYEWYIDNYENLTDEERLKELGDVPIYNVNLEAYWVKNDTGFNGYPFHYIDIKFLGQLETEKWTAAPDSPLAPHAPLLTWAKAPERIHSEECKNKLTPMFHPQICKNYIYGGYYPALYDPTNNITPKSHMQYANHHASWVYVVKNNIGKQTCIDIQGIIGGNIGTLEGGIMLPYSETDIEIIGGMDHNTGTWLPEKYRQPDIQTHLPHIEGKYLVPQPYSRIITNSKFTYNANLLIRDCLYGTPIKINSTLPYDLWVIPDSALAKSYTYPVPWTLIGYNKKRLYCSDIPNTSCYWKQTELNGDKLPYLFGGMSLMQEELKEYRTFIWCVDLNIPDETERPHIEVTVLDWKVPHMYTSEDTSGVYVKGGTLYARSSNTEDIRL